MSTYDPNSPRRPAGGTGGWIIGIIVIVLIGLGVWWWGDTGGVGPRTATNNPPATTSTGSARTPATTGSAPSSAGGPAAPNNAASPAPTK